MARRAKSRTIATFKYPVKVEVREAEFELLASVRYLDKDALAKSKRAEFELGHVKSGCCGLLVVAIVKNGMVTGIRIEPPRKKNLLPRAPELSRLLKAIHRDVLKKRKGAARFPVPVQQFLSQEEGGPAPALGFTCVWVYFPWITILCCRVRGSPDWVCSRDIIWGPPPEGGGDD